MSQINFLWMIGLSSPLLYLIIAVIIDRAVFSKRDVPGFWPLPESTYSLLFGILAFVAIVAIPVVYFLKAKWVAAAGNGDEPRDTNLLLADARSRRLLVLLMACDTIALIGLILFLIQGHLGAMLFFGIVALLNYAAAYPGSPERPTRP